MHLWSQMRCLFALRLNVPALRGCPKEHFFEYMNTKKTKNKTETLKIRVTPNVKKRLQELAKVHGFKLSEYMRQAGLIQEITSRTEVETVLQLARINADQARLGNLLKLAIDMENNLEIEQLIAEIRQTQQQIKEAVHRI